MHIENYHPQEKKLSKAKFHMKHWDVQNVLAYDISNPKMALVKSGFDEKEINTNLLKNS